MSTKQKGTSKEKRKMEVAKNYIILYKDIKEKEAELKEIRPEIEKMLTKGEVIEHELGIISMTESVSLKVDTINLEKALENKELSELDKAKYVDTKYSLTKAGKENLNRVPVLQSCVKEDISSKLNVKLTKAA